ncbi:MAG: hypothetical protein BWY85_02099 [Firmicutes bacterium ADurb.Bin506]|nr:MAG: hypothetical protein BWY85_02099 [Firmicutes bacterium ADurb.Bin506]
MSTPFNAGENHLTLSHDCYRRSTHRFGRAVGESQERNGMDRSPGAMLAGRFAAWVDCGRPGQSIKD